MKRPQKKKDIDEMKEIKRLIEEIYKKKVEKQLDKISNIKIKDHAQNIHKLQNQRKFENQKKITEIKIKGKVYQGIVNIVEAIQKEMELELGTPKNKNEKPTKDEKYFLDKLENIVLSDTEVQELIKPTEEKRDFKYTTI